MVLTIQIIVDTIALLTHEDPQTAVFLFDDSLCLSEGRGSTRLNSTVYPGQMVRWSVLPMDVQAPVWLNGIRFGAEPGPAEPPRLVRTDGTPVPSLFWQGYVPAWLAPGTVSPYELTLGFGAESARTLSVQGPALVCMTSAACAEPPTTTCL